MKRIGLMVLVVWAVSLTLMAREHPSIYVSPSDKETVWQKVRNEAWAAKAYKNLRGKIESYADRHAGDPEWIVSRLAMYWKEGERYTQCYMKRERWDRGEGNAPVPTVRMPGMRTWNEYANVPLEDRTPYNETGDMWGVSRMNPTAPPVKIPYKESGHMIRGNNVEILTLAEDAAFLHWMTGEEKFARFAADIFNTWLAGTYYMQPILDPGKSSGGAGGWEPGGICGYYDYEQIHDDLALHAAVVYDFLYDWLSVHPHPHLKSLGKSTKDVAGEVFKRFIDLGMIRGGRNGNWNVNGWNIMLRPVLVLDDNEAYADGKGRDYYLHYLVEESTRYHEAIPGMLKNYDAVTGLWPESPGYAFSTIQMILDWVQPLRRVGVDIMAGNPILQKAAMAVFPWMDDAAHMVVFGDSRGGNANFRTFENLLAYYTTSGNADEGKKMVTNALRMGLEKGIYDRSKAGWQELCTYVDEIPEAGSIVPERASYSPHHRFIVMKNGDAPYKMMANLYGGKKGFHLTPNGLALQLYAYGYALVPDAAAYESYWSKDYAYHQSPTGSNTILPGYTEGKITVRAMEPTVSEGMFTAQEALTPWVNFVDVEAAEKRRTVVMVRTSPESGYYVDLFRSNQEDNDYLFHHVGKDMQLTDTKGKPLSFTEMERWDKAYHRGYEYFTEIGYTDCERDFMASWTLPENIQSRLWMCGAKGRCVYRMQAPATTMNRRLTPGNVSTPPETTSTLLVRQDGNNAARHPFMAVYEAYKDGKPSVEEVSALSSEGECLVLCVKSTGGMKDYILSAASENGKHRFFGKLTFEGNMGLVRERHGETECLYLGNGCRLSKGGFSIASVTDEPVYAAVFKSEDGRWRYSATASIEVRKGNCKKLLPAGHNVDLEQK